MVFLGLKQFVLKKRWIKTHLEYDGQLLRRKLKNKWAENKLFEYTRKKLYFFYIKTIWIEKKINKKNTCNMMESYSGLKWIINEQKVNYFN